MQSPEREPKPGPKKGWIRAGIAAAVCALVLFFVAVNVPSIAERILSRALHTPVTVNGLGLGFLGAVTVSVDAFEVGPPEARLRLQDATVSVSYGTVFGGDIRVHRVVAGEVRVLLDEDLAVAQNALTEWLARFGGAEAGETPESDTGSSFPRVRIDRIDAQDIAVISGKDALVTASLKVDETDASGTRLAFASSMPFLGDDASAVLSGLLLAGDAGTSLDAEGRVTGVALERVVPSPLIAGALLQVDFVVSSDDGSAYTAALRGAMQAGTEQQLGGDFGARASWSNNVLDLDTVAIDFSTLALTGGGTWAPDTGAAILIERLEAYDLALDVFAELVPDNVLAISLRDDARVAASRVGVGITPANAISIDSGTITARGFSFAMPDGRPIARNAVLDLALEPGAIQINSIGADGMRITGTVELDQQTFAGGIDLEGRIDIGASPIPAWVPNEALALTAGAVELADLSFPFSQNGVDVTTIALDASLVDAGGVVRRADGSEVPVPPINGRLRMANGVLQLESFASEGLDASASVTLSNASSAVGVEANALLDLAHPIIRGFLPPGARTEAGTIRIDRLAGTFGGADLVPPDLNVQGNLTDGRLSLPFGNGRQTIEAISASFESADAAIRIAGAMDANLTGPVRFDGVLEPAAGPRFRGTLDAGFASLGTTLAQAYPDLELAAAVLEPFEAAPTEIELGVGDTAGELVLSILRSAAPPVSVRARIDGNASGLGAVESINAEISVPVEGLAAALPEGASASGSAVVRLSKNAGATTFDAEASLTDVAVSYPPYLNKQMGQALAVVAAGTWQPEGAALTSIVVQALQERIALQSTEGGFRSDGFSVALANVQPMLAAGAVAGGRISGSIQTVPFDCDLQFQDASLAFPEGLSIERIDGGVRFAGIDAFALEQLQITGFDSDFAVDVRAVDGTINGSISGARVNTSAFLEAGGLGATPEDDGADEGEAGDDAEADAAVSEASASPAEWLVLPNGRLSIDLGELLYQTATLLDVSASVAIQDNVATVAPFQAVPGTGTLEGRVVVAMPSEAAAGRIEAEMQMEGGRLSVIDGLVFDPPRGFEGAGVAQFDVEVPFGPGVVPQNGLDGTVEFAAENGSFGTIGVAGEALRLLRTTNLFRLQAPNFGEGGLGFRRSYALVGMEDGLVTIQSLSVEDLSYRIDGGGTIDFPGDDIDLRFFFNFVESVTGIADKIPVLGQVAGAVGTQAGIMITLSGSPNEPTPFVQPANLPMRAVTGIAGGALGVLFGGGGGEGDGGEGAEEDEPGAADEPQGEADSNEDDGGEPESAPQQRRRIEGFGIRDRLRNRGTQ